MAQHIQAQAQSAPLGALVNPIAAQAPKTPEDKESLKSEILAFLTRPEVQAGLLQFAVGVLQPLGPGQSPLGAIARAGAGGLQAAGRVRTQELEGEQEAEKEAFERERTLTAEEIEREKIEAAGERQGVASGATVESAQIGAASRETIADIGATSAAARLAKFRVLSAKEKMGFGIDPNSIAQLNETTQDIKVTRQGVTDVTLKAVLDLRASEQTGKPVTRFATVVEIAASSGNLVPPPSGIRLRTTDEGIEFATGGLELPESIKARTLQRVTSSSELLNNIGTLLDQVERGGKTVSGPLAAFQGLINITAASFIPALFSEDRALFERQLKITREASKRAVSDEQRFTDQDRAFVNELFPSTGVFTNPQIADVKLQVMTAFFLRRLGPDLQAVEIDAAQIPTMEVADLLRLPAKGLLTPREVFRSLEFVFPEQPADIGSLLSTMARADFSNEEMDTVVRQLFPGALK